MFSTPERFLFLIAFPAIRLHLCSTWNELREVTALSSRVDSSCVGNVEHSGPRGLSTLEILVNGTKTVAVTCAITWHSLQGVCRVNVLLDGACISQGGADNIFHNYKPNMWSNHDPKTKQLLTTGCFSFVDIRDKTGDSDLYPSNSLNVNVLCFIPIR